MYLWLGKPRVHDSIGALRGRRWPSPTRATRTLCLGTCLDRITENSRLESSAGLSPQGSAYSLSTMQSRSSASLAFTLLLTVGACRVDAPLAPPTRSESPLTAVAASTQNQKIALVSYSVNFLAASFGDRPTDEYMETLRLQAETHLAAHWSVVPSADFVPTQGYQSVYSESRGVAVPSVGGVQMPVFAIDRPQLIKAGLPQESARALAEAAGADLVAVVYGEWEAKSKAFTPFRPRARSKVLLSIYNAEGTQIHHERRDVDGAQLHVKMYRSLLTPENLEHWTAATDHALAYLLATP